jgi:hypothetical protein
MAAGAEGVERRRDAAQVAAVLAAALALAHVLARERAGAHALAERQREVVADLHAGGVAGLGGLDQPDPGADEQRLDGRDRRLERDGEVGVGQALELAHEQRGALLVGQALDVGDQAAQVVAALGLGERVGQRRAGDLEDIGGRRDRTAQVVDAAVVGHAVQPGLQDDRAIVHAQRVVGAQEHVLQRVLGIRARPGEHLARVREQAGPVAVVDDAEGVVAAGPEEGDELLV